MKAIFVSYRREDAADVSGRIDDQLRQECGGEAIFTDVDNIPLRLIIVFPEGIDDARSATIVVLVVLREVCHLCQIRLPL